MNIDEIMDMLDWNNPPDIQAKGRELARNMRCINVFLQPGHAGHGKNVWDNCAMILAERSDEELRPYLDELFEWLQDMNWPGAYCIYNRLMDYKQDGIFKMVLGERIKEAKALNDDIWLATLSEFKTISRIK